MAPTLLSVQPVLMSRDLPRSLAFYELLGFRRLWQDSADNPRYACISRDGVELHLQWQDGKGWNPDEDHPTYRFPVQDVDGLCSAFRAAGVKNMRDCWDTAWGTREFHVRDPDRNGLQFYCPISTERLPRHKI